MIKFIISESFIKQGLYNITKGYKIAELVFNSSKFGNEILKLDRFTYTKDSPRDVYLKYLSFRDGATFTIKIEPFFYKNSLVIGATSGDGCIYVNTNGASGRSEIDYLKNALHEIAHFPLGYNHGNNFPNGIRSKLFGDFADKTKSVPYVFSEIGNKIYKEIL